MVATELIFQWLSFKIFGKRCMRLQVMYYVCYWICVCSCVFVWACVGFFHDWCQILLLRVSFPRVVQSALRLFWKWFRGVQIFEKKKKVDVYWLKYYTSRRSTVCQIRLRNVCYKCYKFGLWNWPVQTWGRKCFIAPIGGSAGQQGLQPPSWLSYLEQPDFH